jgi:lysyl-tRNA synthetase class II
MLKRIVQHSKCRFYSLKSKSIPAPTTGTEPDNANALPTDYAQRLAFMQASNDTSPYYPHQRSLTTWIALSLFHPTYSHLQPSQSLPTDLISITGRVSSIRSSGEHLHFVDVSEGDDRVQIVLTPDHYINGENFGKDVSGGAWNAL